MIASRQIAADMGLNMKIGDVEYQGDKIKAIFYYIADERVDFRRLRYLCRELEGRDIKTVITLCSEGETLLSDFLGVDVIVFFDTDEKPCSVPSVTWSGDVYSVAELLAGGDSEALDDFSTPQTKEDIWLF